MKKKRSLESGSALFFIFIAIILFAALSFGVANIMRSGDSASVIPREKLKLYAAEIMNYGRSLQEAVKNLKISNGCADTEISFQNTVVPGYTHSPDTSAKCKIFDPAGGGMTWVSPSDNMNDGSEWLITGAHPVAGVGSSEITTRCVAQTGQARSDCVELTLVLPGVSKDLCMYVNEQNGVPVTAGDTPVESGLIAADPSVKFISIFAANKDDFNGRVYGTAFELSGKQVGCFYQSTAGNLKYYVYYTLIAR